MTDKNRKHIDDMTDDELSGYLVSIFLALGVSPQRALNAMRILIGKALTAGKQIKQEEKESGDQTKAKE